MSAIICMNIHDPKYKLAQKYKIHILSNSYQRSNLG